MGIADFSHGVQTSLRQMIEDRLQQQMAQAQMENMAKQRELQGRGLDQNAERIGLEHKRFDYGVEQDQAAAAAAAAQAAGLEEFAGQLPPWMQPVVKGKKYGLNLKPEELVQAPETREAADARKLGNVQKETDIRTSGAIRVKRTPGAPTPQAPGQPRIQQIRGVDQQNRPVVRLVNIDNQQVLAEYPAGMSAEELLTKIQGEAAARERGKSEGKSDSGLLSVLGGLFGGGKDEEENPYEIIEIK